MRRSNAEGSVMTSPRLLFSQEFPQARSASRAHGRGALREPGHARHLPARPGAAVNPRSKRRSRPPVPKHHPLDQLCAHLMRQDFRRRCVRKGESERGDLLHHALSGRLDLKNAAAVGGFARYRAVRKAARSIPTSAFQTSWKLPSGTTGVTLRRLLGMTAGDIGGYQGYAQPAPARRIARFRRFSTSSTAAPAARRSKIEATPGAGWVYSGGGYDDRRVADRRPHGNALRRRSSRRRSSRP